MSWIPTIINLAIAIVAGVALVRWGRQQRARRRTETPAERRQDSVVNFGLIGVTVGILFALTYIVTVDYGPPWLHAWSLPLAVAAIVGGYLLSFLSGWLAR